MIRFEFMLLKHDVRFLLNFQQCMNKMSNERARLLGITTVL